MQEGLEARMRTTIVTYDDGGVIRPGGQCGCCGGGPNAEPDWRAEPWYIYRAGLCDADGVYYGMLCEGCLFDIRSENAKRRPSQRDEAAEVITDLLGDDTDGAEAMMEDMEYLGLLD